jgi:hypothetical protein
MPPKNFIVHYNLEHSNVLDILLEGCMKTVAILKLNYSNSKSQTLIANNSNFVALACLLLDIRSQYKERKLTAGVSE